MPPGEGVHIYRTGKQRMMVLRTFQLTEEGFYLLFTLGRGFAGAFVKPSFFNQINFSRTMLDDHTMDAYFTAIKSCSQKS